MFVVDTKKQSKVIKYRQEQGVDEMEPRTWTIERPGSYAEGWERLRFQTGLVKTISFSMLMASDGGWTVKSIIVELEPDDERQEPGTILTTVGPADGHPMWLLNLMARAEAE
jgi:hypothetical protein